MKLNLLITELNTGGAEKALTHLAIGLQRRHHQVRVLSIGSKPDGARGGLVERLKAERVPVCFGGFDRPSQVLKAMRWLTREFQHGRPDLCQSFLFHANTLGMLAARKADLDHFVGGIRVAEANRKREWIERRACRAMDHVVAVSEKVRTYSVQRLGIDAGRCSVIPNGVDALHFDSVSPADWSELGWTPECQVVLFAGRFHSQKGIELLQERATELLDGDPLRRLLLIGEGPLEQSVRAWAAGERERRVQVLPWQQRVDRYLKAASLVVLPSHYEGMPNVVLEAMAAGRPVVCSLVEGSDELLGHQEVDDGIDRRALQGFAPRSSTEMLQKMDRLLSSPGLADAVGKANRSFVSRHFSIENMIDRYEILYQRLMET